MKSGLIIGTLLLLVLTIVGGWFLYSKRLSSSQVQAACSPSKLPRSSRSIGVPAITPHLCTIPTYTLDDVRHYENTHPFTGMRIGSIGTPTVTKMVFVTSKQASAFMAGESTGLSDNTVVCYVQFHGAFTVGGPPMPTSKKTNTQAPTIHIGEEVFDGVTGNLLVVGVKP